MLSANKELFLLVTARGSARRVGRAAAEATAADVTYSPQPAVRKILATGKR